MAIIHNLPFSTALMDLYYLRRDKSSGPTTNAAYDLGSPTLRWSNIYAVNFIGTAVNTLYADVAERFSCDYPVKPGDIVTLSGDKEISICKQEFDCNIVGVVSLNPAIQMNAGAGPDETHPFIALSGRVLCFIVGPGKKGDRIISSSTMGVGRAVTPEEFVSLSPFCVIGRLLEDKTSDICESVMVILGVK